MRRFVKMQGLGNDFVVFDATEQPFSPTTGALQRIADRRLGVGCDQILVVEPAPDEGIDFGYRIFNADGSEVGQCGNGARCLARFLRDEGLTDKRRVTVRTLTHDMVLEILDDGRVRVDMGVPVLEPRGIPFQPPVHGQEGNRFELDVPGWGEVEIIAVGLGNPHAVLAVSDVEEAPVTELGPLLERHPAFPERVNVGFVQVLDSTSLRLRVFERGVGETLACGSGACAAAVAGRLAYGMEESVDVALRGGHLAIDWEGPGRELWMTGPAERVFEGRLEITVSGTRPVNRPESKG